MDKMGFLKRFLTQRGTRNGCIWTNLSIVLVCMVPLICVTFSAPQYDQSFIKTNFSKRVQLPADNYRGNDFTTLNGRGHHQAGSHRERHSRDTQVFTKYGPIRGLRRKGMGKNEVYVYLGIPFAKPPTGYLRFKKPEPIEPWNGTLYATSLPNSCYQERFESFDGFEGEEMWNPNTPVSEDCLYLNLWAPKAAIKHAKSSSHKKLPVLIWIYGGGYMAGTATLDVYNADIMSSETDSIIITINYRVGAFGYLFFGTDSAPGNQGMYDQVIAMQWVKDNIESFGGDPNSITLFGESAGGGSVSLHLLSPVSQHLVTRGIIQSGPVNAPWSVMQPNVARNNAYQLGLDCGCNYTIDERDKMVECLRQVPASNISILQWNSYKGILDFPSAPTIDGTFFPRHPIAMLEDLDFKATELMIGSNKDEGTYFLLYDFLSYFKKDGPNCISRHQFLEIMNEIFKDRSHMEREAILFQYTHWDNINDNCKNTQMIMDVVGDYYFVCPTNKFAELYAESKAPVYYYYFTHRTSTNPWGEWMGVMHADEIEYVFGIPLNHSSKHTDDEKILSRKIMNYFVRFAETGKPTFDDDEWPTYSRDEPFYLILDTKEARLGRGPRSRACAFWNNFMPVISTGTSSLPSPCNRDVWDVSGALKQAQFKIIIAVTCILVSTSSWIWSFYHFD